MSSRRFRPLLDRVLIKRVPRPQRTVGGITLPDKAQSKSWQGQVLAVGPGYYDHNGKFRKPTIQEGDLVYLSEYGGNNIEIDDESLAVYREEDVLGIIKEQLDKEQN
eukprot:TRINITY_DN26904_c0_g1_i1.p1 TRINITY_DN26904_c0_g1~~TRINITY_DN26904_c0_g1_i1.p1  ORF type:complete len:107 (+),score=22.98 TRINITY_DN26904_c0_g1_i1:231-551(+)